MKQGHLRSPQAVPEPQCTPEVQELRITAGRGSRQPITQLECRSDPDTVSLSYTIAGGEEPPGCGASPVPSPRPWH